MNAGNAGNEDCMGQQTSIPAAEETDFTSRLKSRCALTTWSKPLIMIIIMRFIKHIAASDACPSTGVSVLLYRVRI